MLQLVFTKSLKEKRKKSPGRKYTHAITQEFCLKSYEHIKLCHVATKEPLTIVKSDFSLIYVLFLNLSHLSNFCLS